MQASPSTLQASRKSSRGFLVCQKESQHVTFLAARAVRALSSASSGRVIDNSQISDAAKAHDSEDLDDEQQPGGGKQNNNEKSGDDNDLNEGNQALHDY